MTPLYTARLGLLPLGAGWKSGVSATRLNWLNDKELMRHSENRHTHTYSDEAEAYIQSADYFWGVWFGGGLVGTVAAHVDEPNDVCDVGLLIAEGGKGYGLEAWTVALDYLSGKPVEGGIGVCCRQGHRRITAGAMACNIPMVKIMEKTMRPYYMRKDYFLLDGEPVDSVHFVK